jgi:hypothetical protein
MLDNLSFVLIGLAGLVAFLTFVGAHSSPLAIPNVSKAGCFFAAGLLTIGMASGMYTPVAKYNECMDYCTVAVEDLGADYGESEVFVSPGRVEYNACEKGALEVWEKARKAAEDAGVPLQVEMEPKAVTHARCAVQGIERCTMTCFEGPATG